MSATTYHGFTTILGGGGGGWKISKKREKIGHASPRRSRRQWNARTALKINFSGILLATSLGRFIQKKSKHRLIGVTSTQKNKLD